MAPKPKVLLSEAITEYMNLQRARRGPGEGHRGNATVEADQNVLRMFLRISGDKQVANVTPQHVEDFFYGKGGLRDTHKILSNRSKTQTAPPVSEATHNHYRSRVKAFVSWCINKGYMKPGMLADCFDKSHGRVRPMKVARVVRQRPAPATLMALLDAAANDRDRAYIATGINTALRSSEIRTLRVGNVDLDAGFLYVTIQKTKDSDDQPITLDLDRELRRWLVQYEADLGRPLQPEDYLFPRRRGGLISHYDIDDEGNRVCVRHPYQWSPSTPVKGTHLIVQHALTALGLPTHKEGTHTIRRAVARAYFDQVAQEKGDVAALRETAALLHHTNISTTEVYLGTTPEKESRDRRLKGQPFLSAMVSQENVVPLKPRAAGE